MLIKLTRLFRQSYWVMALYYFKMDILCRLSIFFVPMERLSFNTKQHNDTSRPCSSYVKLATESAPLIIMRCF